MHKPVEISHDSSVLFANGEVRNATGEAILGTVSHLVLAQSLVFLGDTPNTVSRWGQTFPFSAWEVKLNGAPETWNDHVAFYMPYVPFDSAEATHPIYNTKADCGMNEGTEGEYLKLTWTDARTEHEQWVRMWVAGQPEIYGNTVWFGQVCETPVVIPVKVSAA